MSSFSFGSDPGEEEHEEEEEHEADRGGQIDFSEVT